MVQPVEKLPFSIYQCRSCGNPSLRGNEHQLSCKDTKTFVVHFPYDAVLQAMVAAAKLAPSHDIEEQCADLLARLTSYARVGSDPEPPPTPSLSQPCPAPGRNGHHEVYINAGPGGKRSKREGWQCCQACGANGPMEQGERNA